MVGDLDEGLVEVGGEVGGFFVVEVESGKSEKAGWGWGWERGSLVLFLRKGRGG